MSKAKMHFLAVLPPNLIMASINTGPAGESNAQLSTWLSCFNHARFFEFCLHSCIMTDCAGSTFLNHGTSSTRVKVIQQYIQIFRAHLHPIKAQSQVDESYLGSMSHPLQMDLRKIYRRQKLYMIAHCIVHRSTVVFSKITL